ncbi:hypothetical protein BGZ51_003687 [Haplosporangium sp. Z 767]|nr:hypothetical protein BGZ51_003687 [Haplosporangium sp. Z 767]KAF9184547.1 hypothetical protein BGZ50_003596 [Haplosporangium sp. Z 11]
MRRSIVTKNALLLQVLLVLLVLAFSGASPRKKLENNLPMEKEWSNSTDLLTANSTLLSEHKPVPAVQSKVHNLARRYSAMAKQSTATDSDLGLPHNNRSRGGSFGRTEGSKVADLLGKYKETTVARSRASSGVGASIGQEVFQENTTENKNDSESVAMPVSTEQDMVVMEEEEEIKGVHGNENEDVDIEKEIKTSLQVAELTEKVEEIDLVEIPLNNHPSSNDAESASDSDSCEEVEEAVQETNHFDLEKDSSLALGFHA